MARFIVIEKATGRVYGEAKAADVDNPPDDEEREDTERLAQSLRPIQKTDGLVS